MPTIDSYHTNGLIGTGAMMISHSSYSRERAAQVATVLTKPDYVTELKNQGVFELVNNDFQPALSKEQLKYTVLCCGGYDFKKSLQVINGIDDPELQEKLKWFVTTAMWSYSGTQDFDNDSKFATFLIYNLEDDTKTYVNGDFPPSFITVSANILLLLWYIF
ncbi:hypothetical protein [Coleofasciculus chthonoplastes]|jgi:hypothetical protein|uniref:hypothetical protein n=1 Tax=Coleofasciculus chthonoplastes TaxID=64178 RepID=UPI0032F19331